MSIKTQGTAIYFIDPTDDSVNLVGCPTGISVGADTYDQIADDCLGDEEKSFKRGMRTPGTSSMNLNFDPSLPSHLRLHQLYRDTTVEEVKFVIAFSDGTDAPTYVDPDWVLAATRSWLPFDGYISEFPFDIQLNSLVTGSISIQKTKSYDLVPKV